MCKITRKLRLKTVTGYKVAAKNKKTGRYYSPAMGTQYKPGPVKIPKVQKQIGNGFNDRILTSEYSYNRMYEGMTAVFADINGAINLQYTLKRHLDLSDVKKYEIGILKMTISEDLHEGIYREYETVFIGKNIDSFTDNFVALEFFEVDIKGGQIWNE